MAWIAIGFNTLPEQNIRWLLRKIGLYVFVKECFCPFRFFRAKWCVLVLAKKKKSTSLWGKTTNLEMMWWLQRAVISVVTIHLSFVSLFCHVHAITFQSLFVIVCHSGHPVSMFVLFQKGVFVPFFYLWRCHMFVNVLVSVLFLVNVIVLCLKASPIC